MKFYSSIRKIRGTIDILFGRRVLQDISIQKTLSVLNKFTNAFKICILICEVVSFQKIS